MSTALDMVFRKGTLTHSVGLESETLHGYFRLSLSRNYVEARRIRGRNVWSLCRVENVLWFTEATDA